MSGWLAESVQGLFFIPSFLPFYFIFTAGGQEGEGEEPQSRGFKKLTDPPGESVLPAPANQSINDQHLIDIRAKAKSASGSGFIVFL